MKQYFIADTHFGHEKYHSEKARNKCSSRIKTLGKFDGETCTRNLKLWKADFNELINILDIDKGE